MRKGQKKVKPLIPTPTYTYAASIKTRRTGQIATTEVTAENLKDAETMIHAKVDAFAVVLGSVYQPWITPKKPITAGFAKNGRVGGTTGFSRIKG